MEPNIRSNNMIMLQWKKLDGDWFRSGLNAAKKNYYAGIGRLIRGFDGLLVVAMACRKDLFVIHVL